mmetsp:Transcript_123255/g.356084  ORF Transcript_123255/g.356084 Transcript_123255/m.356084 type:complete len:668 (-) Transcript_123255:38-2041(-)
MRFIVFALALLYGVRFGHAAKHAIFDVRAPRSRARQHAHEEPQQWSATSVLTIHSERPARPEHHFGVELLPREAVFAKRLYALGAILVFFVAVATWQSFYGGKALNLFACFPQSIQELFPQHFTHIRDVDHLMLIILFFAGVANVCQCVLYLYTQQGFVCEIVALVFLGPCVVYVYSCLRSYDDRLCTRRQEVEKRREEISEMYQHLLEESEARLQKANESNAGFAEQHFSSRKRDFQRFLEWLSSLELGDPLSDDLKLEAQHLERFVKQWLRAFEETSIDPVHAPRVGERVPFMGILESASGLANNAKELRTALMSEEVEFIKVERDKLLKKKQKHALWKARSVMRRCVKPMKDAKARATEACPSWCSCCVFAGFGFEHLESAMESDTDGVFPVQVSLGCCSFIVMNRGHITVMLGLLIAPILMVCYLVDGERQRFHDPYFTHVGIQASLLLFALCLLIILWDFERIDALMCLEQEIAELDREREDLINQRVRISEFFGKSQALVDFWTTRTLPWLDLLKQMHESIEDACRSGGLDEHLLLNACELVDEVYSRISTVAAWKEAMDGDWGEVGESKKEVFQSFVRSQVNAGDLPHLIEHMRRDLPALSCDFLADVRPHDNLSFAVTGVMSERGGRQKTVRANLRDKRERHLTHSDTIAKSNLPASRR